MKGKSMRIIQISCLLTILFFFNVLGQGSTTPVNSPVRSQVRPSNQTPQMAIADAKARMEVRRKCDSTYRAEIQLRTGDLRKKLMDLVQKQQTLENNKRQNNANLRKMQDGFKKQRIKDSLAYQDTSANRMQRRKDAQNERLAAMKKWQTEQGKIYNDPELRKIRQSIVALRKQIEDSIAVIVKDDSNCLSCYKRRM